MNTFILITALVLLRGVEQVKEPQPRLTLNHDDNKILSVTISPDGRLVATGSDDDTIRVFNVRTGRLRARLADQTSKVRWVRFSPDGKMLASANGNSIQLWETASGFKWRATLECAWLVMGLAFSQDGTLASAEWNGVVRLWKHGKEIRRINAGYGFRASLAFSGDGKLIAVGSREGKVRLFDARTGAERRTLEQHLVAVTALAFSPKGDQLVSGGNDGEVYLWQVQSGQATALRRKGYAVTALAFSSDGKRLAVGYIGDTIATLKGIGSVELYDVKKRRPFVRFAWGKNMADTTVAFSADGRTVATAAKTLELWDISALTEADRPHKKP